MSNLLPPGFPAISPYGCPYAFSFQLWCFDLDPPLLPPEKFAASLFGRTSPFFYGDFCRVFSRTAGPPFPAVRLT